MTESERQEAGREGLSTLFAWLATIAFAMTVASGALSVLSILTDLDWKFALASSVVSATSALLAAVCLAATRH